MPLSTIEFSSDALGRTARMNVLVPNSAKRYYPVLYVQHGLGDTFATFCDRTDLEQLADALDLIVVMPDAGESWFCNDPRPDGLAWEDHLVVEVVDHIDANFPTIATREGRGQAGFSMGGYGAMMLAMKHPDRFGAVCVNAGSFAFGHALRADRPERSALMQAVAPPGGAYDLWVLAEKLAETLAGDGPSMAIRFDVGGNDHLLDVNRRFHDLLEELGIAHQYEEVEGGHQWVYVDRQLPTTLQFAAKHLADAQ